MSSSPTRIRTGIQFRRPAGAGWIFAVLAFLGSVALADADVDGVSFPSEVVARGHRFVLNGTALREATSSTSTSMQPGSTSSGERTMRMRFSPTMRRSTSSRSSDAMWRVVARRARSARTWRGAPVRMPRRSRTRSVGSPRGSSRCAAGIESRRPISLRTGSSCRPRRAQTSTSGRRHSRGHSSVRGSARGPSARRFGSRYSPVTRAESSVVQSSIVFRAFSRERTEVGIESHRVIDR